MRSLALTRAQVREVDGLAIEELGLPGVVLMENAGRQVADIVQGVMGTARAAGERVLVLCGAVLVTGFSLRSLRAAT